MHVSLLHLNRLLEDNTPFKTELEVRLVDCEDPARVEFRNTLKKTDGTHSLCKLHVKMPCEVSLTYHFKLEYFIYSNLLSVDEFWVRSLANV